MKLQQLLHFILQFQLPTSSYPPILVSADYFLSFSLISRLCLCAGFCLVAQKIIKFWLFFFFFFFLKNNRCNLKLYFLHMFKMISVGFIFLSNFVSTVFGVYYYFSCDFSVTKQRAYTCSPTDLLYCACLLSDLQLFY